MMNFEWNGSSLGQLVTYRLGILLQKKQININHITSAVEYLLEDAYGFFVLYKKLNIWNDL